MATLVGTAGQGLGSKRPARFTSLLFGVTVVWSASLLFLVEPLASKLILPWFGGSAAVWITCLLFFQAALLAGYLYAHFLSSILRPRLQVAVHLALLTMSSAALPILPNRRWQPPAGTDPTWYLLAVLGTSVGLPYMLLSSTSPLVQSWFAGLKAGCLPYRYFALSNAGSLLALLSYPVLVEPRLSTVHQAFLWSGAYIGYICLCGGVGWVSRRVPVRMPLSVSGGKVKRGSWGLWIVLSACPSALLLATTSVLTENVAPMPLLWVLPLSVYLLTFILCFDSSRWYRRVVFLPLLLPALGCLAAATGPLRRGDFGVVTPSLLAALFVCCMVCHGELVRLKPDGSGATAFYLALSVGGALGGLFVALIAPHFFRAMFDFPIALICCGCAILLALWREHSTWTRPFQLPAWLFGAVAVVLLTSYLSRNVWHDLRRAIYLGRNFYGALRVEELKDNAGQPVRELMHGTITHGVQYLATAWRARPTTYYTAESGVGLAWCALQSRGPLNIGIVGLGSGTLAAYGRAGDTIHFYEINPLVIDIARKQFNFLSDTPAHVEIVTGDARLRLRDEPPRHFDLLVVDAFTGDAIPVHLLTREAFALYSRHLAPDGVLAIHVSNRYLDLAPVVAAGGAQNGFVAAQVENEDNDRQEVYAASYVLLVRDGSWFKTPIFSGKLAKIEWKRPDHAWTDNFSNLWKVLQLRESE